MVRCTAPFLRCVVAVAHAPSGRGGAEATKVMHEFWTHLSGVLAVTALGDPVIILMDGNARVGSRLSEAVGPEDPGKEDGPGRAMHDMLLDRSLFLPATFLPCAEGGRTWEATDGSMHRIDFVAVPAAWCEKVVSAMVDTSIDLAISRADHRCVVVELQGTFRGGQRGAA